MHRVLISPEGIPKVVSTHSNEYLELLMIGYMEHCAGTKAECIVEKESLLEDVANGD